jgi:hypothetical protein
MVREPAPERWAVLEGRTREWDCCPLKPPESMKPGGGGGRGGREGEEVSGGRRKKSTKESRHRVNALLSL